MQTTEIIDGKPLDGEKDGPATPAAVLRRVIKGFLPLELAPALDAVSRHCRDIHNTTIHLSKTALGCFEYDPKTKTWPWLPVEKRPLGWEPVIAAFAAGAAEINASRRASHAQEMAGHKAALAANPKANIKEPKLTLVADLGDPKTPPSFAILDLTLSGKVVREWVDPLDMPAAGGPAASAKIHEPRPAYARVPSNMAKLAWGGARSSIATAIASQIAWLKTPAEARVGCLPCLPGTSPRTGFRPLASASPARGASQS